MSKGSARESLSLCSTIKTGTCFSRKFWRWEATGPSFHNGTVKSRGNKSLWPWSRAGVARISEPYPFSGPGGWSMASKCEATLWTPTQGEGSGKKVFPKNMKHTA